MIRNEREEKDRHRRVMVPKAGQDETIDLARQDRAAAAMTEAYNLTEQLFKERKPEVIKTWMTVMIDIARTVWGQPVYYRDRQRVLPDCRPGCSYCCATTVSASPMEAFMVAGQLLEREDAAAVRARVRERAALIARASIERRELRRIACGALDDDGKCGAHANRPLPCRGLISFDAKACELQLPGKDGPPVDRGLIGTVAALQAGALRAALEAGLDVEPGELTLMLDAIMDDFQGSVERWLAGEKVFTGATLPELRKQWAHEQVLWGALPGKRQLTVIQ